MRNKLPVFKPGALRPSVDIGPIFIEGLGVIHYDSTDKYNHSMALGSDYLGHISWYGGEETRIPEGTLPLNGQVLNRDTWANLYAMVSGGGWDIISDTEWLADPTKRNCFSTGNGINTFRMPDLNAYQFGSTVSLSGIWSSKGLWLMKAEGSFARSNYNSVAQITEQYDLRVAEMSEQVRLTGQMFDVFPHNGPIETIPVGSVPANGQKVYAALYPAVAAALEAGKQFMVSEVNWNASDTYKGCWSSGGTDEGGRWYRAPKLNADTNYRAPFLRGSQIGVDAGKITDDRIRNIEATFNAVSSDATPPTGAITVEQSLNGSYPTDSTNRKLFKFNASRVVPTGTENSPRYHGVIMCVRMFGTVSNPGSLDAAQLATDLAVARAEISALPKIQASGAAPVFACRAWVNFNGTGTVVIRASGNVSSITDHGTGDYTVNFTTPMQDTDFTPVGSISHGIFAAGIVQGYGADNTDKTVSGWRFRTGYANPPGSNWLAADYSAIHVAIFR